MKPPQPAEDDGFFCTYAADIILPLLQTLEIELAGVIKSEDIEPVHQCRVATRRIRAALPIFSSCFTGKKVRRWQREIKTLTQALGQARDLDVQIEFIRSHIKEHVPRSFSTQPLFRTPDEYPSTPDYHEVLVIPHILQDNEKMSLPKRIVQAFTHMVRPVTHPKKLPEQFFYNPAKTDQIGLECLVLRLEQKRKKIQDQVVSSVQKVHESKVIPRMREEVQACKIHAAFSSNCEAQIFTYEQAYIHIVGKIADLIWFELYLKDPDAHTKHHQMRIAAKRLRYTLETFSELFNDNLKKEIGRVKKLQEILGDIHDCDVWVEYLPVFLAEEKANTMEYTGNTRIYDLVTPGIFSLIEDRKNVRITLFNRLVEIWSDTRDNHFFEELSSKVSLTLNPCFQGERKRNLKNNLTIAYISDIHANLPALEAVLADADSRDVGAFFCAGDLIGYGGFPNETIDLIRSKKIPSVIGNYDLSVIDRVWKTKKIRSKEKRLTMRWTFQTLSKENRTYLSSLPQELQVRLQGKNFLITHGSPESLTEYLTTQTPACRFSELAEMVHADVVITGHSHLPSVCEHNGTLFVNCGSVGRPEDGDPRACYAMITFNPLSVSHIRVPYDVKRAITRITESQVPIAIEHEAVMGGVLIPNKQ